MSVLESFRVECDECRKQLMGVFDTLHDAETAAIRAGWLCRPLGGDVLCPLCRRTAPPGARPGAVAVDA